MTLVQSTRFIWRKRKSLNAYIKEIEGDVKKRLADELQKAVQDNTEHDTNIAKVISNVDAFRQEMKNALDIQFDSLIDTLQKPNDDKINFVAQIQKQQEKVDKIIEECKAKIWEGKLDLIEYNPPSPSSLVP